MQNECDGEQNTATKLCEVNDFQKIWRKYKSMMDTGKYSSGTEMDQSMGNLTSTDQDSMDNDPKRPRKLSPTQIYQSSQNMGTLGKRNEFVDNVEPMDSDNIIQECRYEVEIEIACSY
ncbi:hypothetical protein SNEBB_009023 [Seison nebaliae]|nr:hypothetical protein SNEBB_009023 [Seison nebaliae]